jgi:outer membrane lipoprotein-sorting protein
MKGWSFPAVAFGFAMNLGTAAVAQQAPAAVPPSSSSPSAPAAPSNLTPLEILQKMEGTNNGFADQQMEIKLTIVDIDGSKKSYDLTVFQKGDTKRLVEFTSGENKGMATLVEDRDSVYVYLPGFKKVRRVGTSNMNQTLAGSDLSSDDMAMVTWSKEWDPKLEKEDDVSWWLSLTPKAGSKTEYGRVVQRVAKQGFEQMETDYFNRAGEKIKTLVGSDLTDYHGVPRYKHVVVTDPRTGHRTEIEIKDFKANQGLKDDLFTVRQLQWGK